MVALDRQFYDVLGAVLASSPEAVSCTDSARAAVAGALQSETYLAAMIEEGWLDGVVEREPTGDVRAVFIRTISTAGRTALAEKLAQGAGQEGLAALGRIARGPVGEVQAADAAELDRLRRCDLIAPGSPLTLTDLGELVLSEQARHSLGVYTTIIQGVTNSQVAVGSSRIKGRISIVEQPLDRSHLIATVEELASKVTELELARETEEEILVDLATIRTQLNSPKPKRNIVRACAENIQAVLQSAAGSAVYVGFIEILKRLMS